MARCRKSIGEPVGADGPAVLGHGGAKDRQVHSWAGERVSQNTIGTLG